MEQKPESQTTTSSTATATMGLPYPAIPLFGAGSGILPSPNVRGGITAFRPTRSLRRMPAPKRLQKPKKQVKFATPQVSQQQVGPSPPRRSSRLAAAQSATSKPSMQPKALKRPLQSNQTSPSPSKVSRLQPQSPKGTRAAKQIPSQRKSSPAGGHLKAQQSSSRVLRVTVKETTASIVTTRHSSRSFAGKQGKQ